MHSNEIQIYFRTHGKPEQVFADDHKNAFPRQHNLGFGPKPTTPKGTGSRLKKSNIKIQSLHFTSDQGVHDHHRLESQGLRDLLYSVHVHPGNDASHASCAHDWIPFWKVISNVTFKVRNGLL